jgi:hypothetical protein
LRDWESVLLDPGLWAGNLQDLRVSTVENIGDDIAAFCPALRRNRKALDEVQTRIKEGILPLVMKASTEEAVHRAQQADIHRQTLLSLLIGKKA